MNIVEVGLRILFLPVVIIVGLLTIGFFLVIIERLLSLLLRVPISIVNRSIGTAEEEKDQSTEKASEEKSFDPKKIWLRLKSGSWIVSIAVIPLILTVFILMIYLFERLLNVIL